MELFFADLNIGGVPIDALGLVLLLLAGIGAGIADATTGGGGVVQIPILFSVASGAPVAPTMALNKASAAAGNLVSYLRFRRAPGVAHLDTRAAAVACAVGIPLASAGVLLASRLSTAVFTPLIAITMVAVLFYIVAVQPRLVRKQQATIEAGEAPSPNLIVFALIVSAVAFYDGFLGPATGSFLILIIQYVLSVSLGRALATAKFIQLILNTTGAVAYWLISPPSLALVLLLALGNAVGGWFGSKWVVRFSDSTIRACLVVGVIASLVLMLGRALIN
ncbi:sulfite exporter TauE/SafE family protein [Corynebacterium sp. H113]|uniref:sulfite exporter TauE/SafE family protein n=1 Tax=Corynebacterium sp. H113 TaxID=3133419 RepID=UPI00309CE308